MYPKNIYGLTKKHNEELALHYNKIYGLKIIGLRFFTVFGEWGRPDMLFLKFFKYAEKKKKFFVNNKGNHYRDFTYIKDVIDVLKLLMNRKINNHQIYNICSSRPRKLLHIINYLKKITNFNLIKNNKLQSAEALKTHGSNRKLLSKIKFKFKSDFKLSLDNTYKWYVENKNLL